VRAIRDLRPGVIRFGGSSLITYGWETGIAPRSQRAAFLNQPWGNTESHDVGLFEFLELCELAGAEPLVCTNSNSSTTASILNEIEFCNGPADSPFGRLRAELGHPEPFGVTYWQIGNEQAGAEYERRLVADARAIRSRHPDVRLLASYPSETIIAELSDAVDFVCPHFYVPYSEEGEKGIRDLIDRIRTSAKNPGLRIAVTEWNITAGAWGWGRSWLLTQYCALNAARMFQMYQRLGDMIRIANRSNMTNSCNSGIIQTNSTGLYVTPTYHAQRAFATFSGDVPLRVDVGAGEHLGLSATRRSSDGEIALFVVNADPEERKRAVDLGSAGAHAREGRLWTLAADSLEAANSWVEPERVAPVESLSVVRGGAFEHTFPPFSVTVLRLPASD
jgi:alpha-N-arabinofuranosidase